MRKLKNSGIEWLSKIPENWEVKRLKQILAERNEKNNPIKSKNILSLSIERGVFPYSEKTGGGNKAKENIEDYKLAYKDDIVLNSMNVIVGAVGLSRYYGCVSPVYYTLYSRNDNYNINYYSNIFASSAFQKSLWGLGNGIVVKESDNGKINTIRMRIPMDKLNNVLMPIPPREEQEKIAKFLDKKVTEIDNIIDKTKETIEDYKKYKQSKINQLVTEGIKKHKNKKINTGWIKEIPEEWKEYKTKDFFEFGKGLPITKADLVEEGKEVISYGQIHSKTNNGTTINKELYRFVSEKYLETNRQSIANYNNFIFADTSEDLSGCGNCVFINEDINIFAGYHTIILRPKIKEDMKYLSYLFLTDCWRNQIRARVSGIKLFSITQRILKETFIILPMKEERDLIVKNLDKLCTEIDKLIYNKEKIIEELENYKDSLIYEYVTGKKEVI